ncbi:MAG: hypothetical protein Q4D54_06310 [Eubacteriales bacterium]|nr:hypothetical protein [Eubacteriales bacterium]
MKRNVICGLLSFVIGVMLVGCQSEHKPDESNGRTESGKTEMAESEDGELVTVDDFANYYKLTAEDLEAHDIEGFIMYHEITSNRLETRDWMSILEKDETAGISYRHNIYRQVTSAKTRMATYDDDFAEAQYIVYETQIYEDEGIGRIENVIIDIPNQKVYCGFDYNDYTKCEKSIDVDETFIRSIISDFNDMKLPEWENNILYACEGNAYWWDLHIIMSEDDVIRYTGNIPGNANSYEDGFEQIKNRVDTLF